MAKAINNSKILFNINAQGISSLNYRTFQAAACKRLMISDYREELVLFEGHMPFYEDFSDLIFKIESYLEDKEAYKKLPKNAGKLPIIRTSLKMYQIYAQNYLLRDFETIIYKLTSINPRNIPAITSTGK